MSTSLQIATNICGRRGSSGWSPRYEIKTSLRFVMKCFGGHWWFESKAVTRHRDAALYERLLCLLPASGEGSEGFEPRDEEVRVVAEGVLPHL